MLPTQRTHAKRHVPSQQYVVETHGEDGGVSWLNNLVGPIIGAIESTIAPSSSSTNIPTVPPAAVPPSGVTLQHRRRRRHRHRDGVSESEKVDDASHERKDSHEREKAGLLARMHALEARLKAIEEHGSSRAPPNAVEPGTTNGSDDVGSGGVVDGCMDVGGGMDTTGSGGGMERTEPEADVDVDVKGDSLPARLSRRVFNFQSRVQRLVGGGKSAAAVTGEGEAENTCTFHMWAVAIACEADTHRRGSYMCEPTPRFITCT